MSTNSAKHVQSLFMFVVLQLGWFCQNSSATVYLPQWFNDNMVLQDGPMTFLAGITVPAGEVVKISGDTGEYSIQSETGSGHWKLTLNPSSQWKHTNNMTISIVGATGPAVTVTNVLPGDVFFCSGQSNMLFSLAQSLNYTEEAATLLNHPNFRFFMTSRAFNSTPQWDMTPQPMAACDAATPSPPPPSSLTLIAVDPSCSASAFLNNTDFHDGQGLGSTVGKSPSDCCEQCGSAEWKAKGCLYFTFAPGSKGANSTCWFKKDDNGIMHAPGAVSGSTGAPVPPPPSPTPPPPQKPCNQWLTQAQASADDAKFLLTFSAVCFMTVRNIAEMHTGDRPMGLVQSAWGGSRIEAWMSAKAIANAGAPVTGNVPVSTASNGASALFNGMVSPWTNFSIKAAMWYQGEANADQSCQSNGTSHTQPVEYYASAYAAMLKDWRDAKGAGDFPIGTMQLPPSVATGNDPAITNPKWAGRPVIRAAQALSAAHPGNTTDVSGVAVTIDLGGSSNWGFDHPPNKNEMSRRLALQLLHTAYGLNEDSIPLWTGPVLVKATRSMSSVELTFTSQTSAGGLTLNDVKAPGSCDDSRGGVCNPANNCTKCCDGGGAPFEITFDSNPSRVDANISWIRLPRAKIVIAANNTIQLITAGANNNNGADVTGVRYAWTDFVDCVLSSVKSDGIPASPFRQYFA